MDPPPSSTPRQFQTRKGIQRTSKEARDALESAEADRQAQRLAQEAAQAHSSPLANLRGRGRGRGRGAAVVHEAERIRRETSSGVFGAAVPRPPRGRGRGGLRSSGLVEDTQAENVDVDLTSEPLVQGGEKVATEIEQDPTKTETQTNLKKPAAKNTPTRKKTKEDGPILVSENESSSDEIPRRDIETIELSSDEYNESDDSAPITSGRKGKQPASRARPKPPISLRPVRAPRDVDPNNELSSFSSRRKARESLRDRDKAAGGEDEFDGTAAEDDVMEIDEPGPMLPKPKRKASQLKDSRVIHETIEERAERLRYQDDLRKLRQAFSPVIASSQAEPASLKKMDFKHSDNSPNLMLFQFPPLTPMLIDPVAPAPDIEIKQEPESDPPATLAGPSVSISQSFLKTKSPKAEVKVKKDPDAEDTEVARGAAKIYTADSPLSLPSGVAGRLNVHRSGKITLEWGTASSPGEDHGYSEVGTNMEVKWGSEVGFLQDVVCVGAEADADEMEGLEVEPVRDGEQRMKIEEGKSRRKAWAMGRVRDKVVVVPDWEKIYE